jgi:hypothetical protein
MLARGYHRKRRKAEFWPNAKVLRTPSWFWQCSTSFNARCRRRGCGSSGSGRAGV